MKRRRFSEEQITGILTEKEARALVADSSLSCHRIESAEDPASDRRESSDQVTSKMSCV
jgi:hypothetical protein